MKYYQVSRSAEPKIIGVKDGMSQVEIMESEIEKNQNYIDFKNHFSGNNKDFWVNQDKIIKLNPPSVKGNLRKGAKLTDIMEYGPWYSFLHNLYSQRYIDIIKVFNISQFKTFEFQIQDVAEKYFLLFIETIIFEDINFEKSIVTTGYKVTNNLKYHTVNNLIEYREFKQKNIISSFEKLAIPKKHIGKDIIETQATVLPFYSEKLIDFLLDCGITGLQVSYNNSIQLEFV